MRFSATLVQGTGLGRPDVFSTEAPVLLTVAGDDPPRGDVTLILWEFDPPHTPGGVDRNNPTGSDMVIAIPGRIVAKPGPGAGHRFVPKPDFRWPTVAEGPGTFQLQLDGDPTTHRLAIPRNSIEDDSDLYGVAWKLMVRFVRGLDKDGVQFFETQSWVLLRDFRNFEGVEAGRPVVAIHATESRGDPNNPDGYAEAAAAYWALHADINTNIGSLEEILQFLRGEQNWGEGTLIRRDWALGPWGQVNIIAHGWFHTWSISVLKRPPRLSNQAIPEQDWITRFELEDERRAHAADRLRPPGPHLLDERCKIAARGCVIGRDTEFARAIFETFGARSPTYVSKLLTGYQQEGRRVRAFARECWLHVRRVEAQPGDPGEPSGEPPPTPRQRAAFLARKYDRAAIDPRAPGYDRNAERAWMGRVTEPPPNPPPVALDRAWAMPFEVDFARDHPDALLRIETAKRNPTTTWQLECRRQWMDSVFERELRSGRHEDLIGTTMVPDTIETPPTGTWRWREPLELEPGKFIIRLAAQISLTIPVYRVDPANHRSAFREIDLDSAEQYQRIAGTRRP